MARCLICICHGAPISSGSRGSSILVLGRHVVDKYRNVVVIFAEGAFEFFDGALLGLEDWEEVV